MKQVSMLFVAVLFCIMLATAYAKWTTFCYERGSCPGVLIDIAAIDATGSFAVAGGDSSSTTEERSLGIWAPTDPSNPESLQRLKHNGTVGMGVALTAANGVIASAGIGVPEVSSNIWYSWDSQIVNSATWFNAVGQDIKAVTTPEHRKTEDTLLGFVGGSMFEEQEYMLLSQTGGKDWFTSPTPANVKFLRYAAYPSPRVFYLTAGTWPSSLEQEAADAANKCLRLSEHYCQPAPHMTPDQVLNSNKRVYNLQRKMSSNGKYDGYYGSISVTRDGGKTWVTNFASDEFYFNDIACISETACAAVAEGNKNAHVWATVDGGLTWTKTFEITSQLMASLFRIRAINGEYFISGGKWDDEKGGLFGLIYKSLDQGRSWVPEASVDEVGILVGLTFTTNGKRGFAVGSTQDQRTIIAQFDRD